MSLIVIVAASCIATSQKWRPWVGSPCSRPAMLYLRILWKSEPQKLQKVCFAGRRVLVLSVHYFWKEVSVRIIIVEDKAYGALFFYRLKWCRRRRGILNTTTASIVQLIPEPCSMMHAKLACGTKYNVLHEILIQYSDCDTNIENPAVVSPASVFHRIM